MTEIEQKRMVYQTRDGLTFDDWAEASKHEYDVHDKCDEELGTFCEKLEKYSLPYTAIDTIVEDGNCEAEYFRLYLNTTEDRDHLINILERDWAFNDVRLADWKSWKWGIKSTEQIVPEYAYIICSNCDLGMFIYSAKQLLGELSSDLQTAFYGKAEKAKETEK